jgi:hypothetical protein
LRICKKPYRLWLWASYQKANTLWTSGEVFR